LYYASLCGNIGGIDYKPYNGSVKKVKSNLLVLAAEKAQREKQRVSLIRVAKETGISKYTIYALANNELHEFPREVIEKLCTYFDCAIGDLLKLEEVEEPDTA
jgi:putative transcriptional regulator